MGESIGEDELRSRLTSTHIEMVNKMMPSPEDRAGMIWTMLQDSAQGDDGSYISNWDMICFSVEILGLFSAEFPWMKESAKQINQLVYKAHYLNHDKIREHEVDIVRKEESRGMKIPKMTGA